MAFCAVCHETYPIQAFKILKCGHCYCKGCIAALKSRGRAESKCPECREVIHARDGGPIHIHLSDPTGSASGSSQPINLPDGGFDADTARAIGRLADEMDTFEEGMVERDLKKLARRAESVVECVSEAQGCGGVVLRLLRAFYALLQKRLIPKFDSLSSQATRAAELSDTLSSTRSRLQVADALITELRAKDAAHAKTARFMKEREDAWKREKDEKERMGMEMREVMEQTKHYKALLAKRIVQVRSQRETIKHMEKCLEKYRDVGRAEESCSELVGESLVVMPNDCDMDMDTGGTTRDAYDPPPSDHDGIHILPAVDLEGRPGPTFASDWQLKQAKAVPRKVHPPKKVANAIRVDEKGRVRGAVMLGSRIRLRG